MVLVFNVFPWEIWVIKLKLQYIAGDTSLWVIAQRGSKFSKTAQTIAISLRCLLELHCKLLMKTLYALQNIGESISNEEKTKQNLPPCWLGFTVLEGAIHHGPKLPSLAQTFHLLVSAFGPHLPLCIDSYPLGGKKAYLSKVEQSQSLRTYLKGILITWLFSKTTTAASTLRYMACPILGF